MRWAGAVLALALVVPGTAVRAAPLLNGTTGCVALAFSPAVATDHLGLCVGYSQDTPTAMVSLTRDSGHTWLPLPAAGLVFPYDLERIDGIAFSPSFASDHTVFLHINAHSFPSGGVYSSTDLGATWTLVDDSLQDAVDDLVALPPAAVGLPVAQPTVAAGLPIAQPTVATLSRESDDAVVVTSGPLRISAAGSVDEDVQLLPVPEGALMLARTTEGRENDGTNQHATLYSCDARITCATQLHAWPRGELPWRAWLAPDYTTSHEVVVLTRAVDHLRTPHLWTSRDGGRHFTAYAAANKILATAAARGRTSVWAGIAWRPGHPATRYLRVTTPDVAWGLPTEEIYRTDNAGKTWRRAAHRTCTVKGGYLQCAGSIPWELPVGYALKRLADVTVLPDGRLLFVGMKLEYMLPNVMSYYASTWCSVDGGKHFARNCAT